MTTKRCSIEDCDRPLRAKGLCAAHYERLRKYGDPTYVPVQQPMSEETKRKISSTTMGRAKAPGRINGPPSEETRRKISVANMGNTNGRWPVGVPHTEETRAKMSAAKLGVKLGPQPKKYIENPGYQAVHRWMRRHYDKTGFCEVCGEEKLTYWSNINGEYRRLREDFWELCVPCHKIFDYILAIDRFDPEWLAIMYAKRDIQDD